MSKASEWAEKAIPNWDNLGETVSVSVSADGGAVAVFPFAQHGDKPEWPMTPGEALSLGRWLMETFGDDAPRCSECGKKQRERRPC